MSGFGVLWRIQTRKHIRTRRSLFTSSSSARARWPRLQETESLLWELKRLRARRHLHEQRRAR